MKLRTGMLAAAVAAVVAAPSTVFATAGYFGIGQGAKSMGIAGGGSALPQDSICASMNPGCISFVPDGTADIDIRFFSPRRQAELDPRNFGGQFKVNDDSTRQLFAFPHFGWVKELTPDLTMSITGYSNGGMNTNYDRNIYDETAAVLGAFQQGFQQALQQGATPQEAQQAGAAAAASVPSGTGTGTPNTSTLGIDFGQVTFAPTLAYKLTPDHSFGLSALLGVQRLSTRGLGNFQCFTPTGAFNNPQACSPGGLGPLTPGFVGSSHLTNRGSDWSYGAGVRVGWVGKLLSSLTMGAAYSSKIWFTEFDKYKELLAEQGDLDAPANMMVGLAYQPLDRWTFTFDWQRIFYNGVRSLNNVGPIPSPLGPAIPSGSGLLGQDNGLGFGWNDINAFKFGAVWDYDDRWTLRAGLHYNENPVHGDQLLFNILAPAVVKYHGTLGFTYRFSDESELSFAYMHAFKNDRSSNQTAFGVPGKVEMYQNSVDLQYSTRF